MDLLKHLNILAEVKDESDDGDQNQSKQKFIMPAVLKHASEEELEQPTLIIS